MNAENAAAQVEAEKCAVIATEVSIKQASCEKDLAAAEPLVAQAEAALDTLNKKVGTGARSKLMIAERLQDAFRLAPICVIREQVELHKRRQTMLQSCAARAACVAHPASTQHLASPLMPLPPVYRRIWVRQSR